MAQAKLLLNIDNDLTVIAGYDPQLIRSAV